MKSSLLKSRPSTTELHGFTSGAQYRFCSFWRWGDDRDVMTYPSVVSRIPILKLNLHNSFLKGLSLLLCCLCHTSLWELTFCWYFIRLDHLLRARLVREMHLTAGRVRNVLFKYNLFYRNLKKNQIYNLWWEKHLVASDIFAFADSQDVELF